jgi:hypothetical protein
VELGSISGIGIYSKEPSIKMGANTPPHPLSIPTRKNIALLINNHYKIIYNSFSIDSPTIKFSFLK